MPTLIAIAPIIWAKWGGLFLETLRQEASAAADDLSFRAMNSETGIRTLLVVCTTNRNQAIEEALRLNTVTRLVDWENYSVAEMVFKTEKGSGFGHQERCDDHAALVLCATRPTFVQSLEQL